MLNGKLVEGTHEKLISPEMFLQIHDVRAAAKGKYGVRNLKRYISGCELRWRRE
jgi:hypothetical protein